MRLPATISCYEQRDPVRPVGIDAFCREGHYPGLEHYTPFARRRPTYRATSSPRTQIARPSRRQDSNLRPLVPQTSPYFPIRVEFDLERFHRKMVGKTTRPCFMEWVGIAPTRNHAHQQRSALAIGVANSPQRWCGNERLPDARLSSDGPLAGSNHMSAVSVP
jgi:hypothetical protein